MWSWQAWTVTRPLLLSSNMTTSSVRRQALSCRYETSVHVIVFFERNTLSFFFSLVFLHFLGFVTNRSTNLWWGFFSFFSVPFSTPAAADRGAYASTTWPSIAAPSWLISTVTVRQIQSSISSPNMVRRCRVEMKIF